MMDKGKSLRWKMTKSGIKGKCTREEKGKTRSLRSMITPSHAVCWWCNDVDGGHHVREYPHFVSCRASGGSAQGVDWPGPTLPSYDSKETVGSTT
jgi:hypothetical protein